MHKYFHTKLACSQRWIRTYIQCIHHSVIRAFISIQLADKAVKYLIDSYKLLLLIVRFNAFTHTHTHTHTDTMSLDGKGTFAVCCLEVAGCTPACCSSSLCMVDYVKRINSTTTKCNFFLLLHRMTWFWCSSDIDLLASLVLLESITTSDTII